MARESYSVQQAKIAKEINKLKKKAEALQTRRRKPVLAAIIRDMREYAITAEEIAVALGKTGTTRRAASPRKNARASNKPVEPKYRHPDGSTWSGRGKPPRWLSTAEAAGTPRSTFLIAAPTAAQ